MEQTPDKIEPIFNSTIQHGKKNNRIYLMNLDPRDNVIVIEAQLNKLALENNYSKIFIKIPLSNESFFKSKQYTTEATIPCFYRGKTTALLMAKYLTPDRFIVEKNISKKIFDIIKIAQNKKKTTAENRQEKNKVFLAKEPAATEISALYKKVFKTYPFPIFDPLYIKETMRSHIKYFFIKKHGKIVAVSSAEIDRQNQNAEMTDFATLQEYRGNQLGLHLLLAMEKEIQKENINTVYTIARAIEPGINITFSKANYTYSGTLINNTNISGNIESMNVWHKKLAR